MSEDKRAVDRMARVLMAEWERVEHKPVNASYVATFVDLARVAIAEVRPPLDVPTVIEALRESYERGVEPTYHEREHAERFVREYAALTQQKTGHGELHLAPDGTQYTPNEWAQEQADHK